MDSSHTASNNVWLEWCAMTSDNVVKLWKLVAGLTWRLTKLVTMSLMMVRHYVVHSFWYFWGASRGTRLRVCWHTTSRTLPFKMDVLKQNPSTLDWPIVLNTITWVFFFRTSKPWFKIVFWNAVQRDWLLYAPVVALLTPSCGHLTPSCGHLRRSLAHIRASQKLANCATWRTSGVITGVFLVTGRN